MVDTFGQSYARILTMPWNVKDAMSLREKFVSLAASRTEPFSELCRRCSISRQTGYEWVERHRNEGQQGLAERSRRSNYTARVRLRASLRACWRCVRCTVVARSRGACVTSVIRRFPRRPRSPRSCAVTR
ncbi:helix-turn-helix domain-containing protein [Paraburkholderia sp. J67]|uniref:helix-turn-helix domain-containing protein n=1 Tax=Paraburkholderia sp. J67 TaxID=2805435 RepID=UPI0039F4C03F